MAHQHLHRAQRQGTAANWTLQIPTGAVPPARSRFDINTIGLQMSNYACLIVGERS